MAKYDVSKVSPATLAELAQVFLDARQNIAHTLAFTILGRPEGVVGKLFKEAEVQPRTRAEVDTDIANVIRSAFKQLGSVSAVHSAYTSPLSGKGSTPALDISILLAEETKD